MTATLGFRTKRDAIVHLHGLGHGPSVIAREVGSTLDSVRSTLCQLRMQPHRDATSLRNGASHPLVSLSPDVLGSLRPHAARRGLSVAALAALIVDTVVLHDLVDATLDDREG